MEISLAEMDRSNIEKCWSNNNWTPKVTVTHVACSHSHSHKRTKLQLKLTLNKSLNLSFLQNCKQYRPQCKEIDGEIDIDISASWTEIYEGSEKRSQNM